VEIELSLTECSVHVCSLSSHQVGDVYAWLPNFHLRTIHHT